MLEPAELRGGHAYVLERLRGAHAALDEVDKTSPQPLADHIGPARDALRDVIDDASFPPPNGDADELDRNAQRLTGRVIALEHAARHPRNVSVLLHGYKRALEQLEKIADGPPADPHTVPCGPVMVPEREVRLVYDPEERGRHERGWELVANGELKTQYLRNAADRGRRDAQFEMARRSFGIVELQALAHQGHAEMHYELALRLPPEAARPYLEAAAREGHAFAQYELSRQLVNADPSHPDQVRRFHTLQLAAGQEHGGAQRELALVHEAGIGTPIDLRVADELIRRGAENGDALAMMLFADAHLDGRRRAKDWATAFAWYEKSANLGFAPAQRRLGIARLRGTCGQTVDPAAGFDLLRRAAEQGDVEASRELAGCYYNGWGAPKNDALAFSFMRNAAGAGDAAAGHYLGLFHATGIGTPKDARAALACFETAADAGYVRSMTEAGHLYAQGHLGPGHDAKAVECYRKAAEAKQPEAEYELGCMYRDGRGVAADGAAALRLISRAADAKHAPAMRLLGSIHAGHLPADGLPIEPNPKTGITLLHAAADGNDVTAMLIVAKDALEGRHGVVDPVRAADLLRRAAEAGDKDGQRRYALLLEKGHGTAKNEGQACRWLAAAAAQREPDAMREYGMRLRDGRGVRRDPVQAREYLRLAAEANDVRATVALGEMFRHGEGVAPDRKYALQLFQRAAGAGDTEAEFRCGEVLREVYHSPEQMGQPHPWFARAAKKGHAGAQTALADLIFEDLDQPAGLSAPAGFSSPKACATYAMNLYERAAAQGNTVARYRLARKYAFGYRHAGAELVPQDYAAVRAALAPVIEQAPPFEQYLYGRLLEGGRGGRRNALEARRLYEAAAAAGDMQAQNAAGVLATNRGDHDQAFALYEKSAWQRFHEGQYHYAECFRNGSGTSANVEQAMLWYERAAEQGSLPAHVRLGEIYAATDPAKALEHYRKAAAGTPKTSAEYAAQQSAKIFIGTQTKESRAGKSPAASGDTAPDGTPARRLRIRLPQSGGSSQMNTPSAGSEPAEAPVQGPSRKRPRDGDANRGE